MNLGTISKQTLKLCYKLSNILDTQKMYCHSLVLILILISIKTRIDNIFGQNTTTPPTRKSNLLDIAQTIATLGPSWPSQIIWSYDRPAGEGHKLAWIWHLNKNCRTILVKHKNSLQWWKWINVMKAYSLDENSPKKWRSSNVK